MKRETLSMTGFAGLELDKHPLLAAQKDDGRFTASTATNVAIDQVTRELIKAKGSSVWVNLATVTGEVVLRIMEYKYQDGRRVFIARTSGGFYQLNDTLTTYTAMNTISSLPANTIRGNEALQIPSYCQVGRHMVIVDGSGSYYWDGVAANIASSRVLDAPQAWSYNGERPKLELASGGSLSANTTYSVQIAFYNGTSYSPPLPCGSIRTDGSNKKIKVYTGYGIAAGATGDGYSGEGTGRAAVPNGATHIYVYVAGHTSSLTGYYQFATSVVNPAGTVGDEIVITVDTAAATTVLPDFHGAPGGCSVVCEHVGRAFYSGSPGWPVRVWYSEAGRPFNINGTSWFDVGDFADPVVSLASFPYSSQLLGILKLRSIWSLAGFDDDSFLSGLQREDDSSGCVAPHSPRLIGKSIYFAGTSGYYRWDQGSAPVDISGGIRNYYLQHIRGAA